jgi:dephospho-CoA kinase
VFLIGLTGGIASGKSTVARALVEHGAFEIDADQVAREVVVRGSSGLAEVVESFGEEVLDENMELDRAKLAGIIFSDPQKRLRLEEILHPLIRARTAELISKSDKDIIVYSVPLLVESGVDHDFDLIVTVEAGEAEQIRRLVISRGLSEVDAKARVGAQATRDKRIGRAGAVIDSSGTKDQLNAQVEALWEKIIVAAGKKQDLGKN